MIPKTQYIRSAKLMQAVNTELNGWYEQRFTERKTAIHCQCEVCKRDMWFPKSKVGKYKTCGGSCKETFEKMASLERVRPCKTCGGLFTPRAYQLANGVGMFCSQKCNTNGRDAMLTKESKDKSSASFRLAILKGTYVPAKGDQSPFWKGGYEAHRARMQASGRLAEFTRRYRKKNPEKVREFTERRNSKKLGRLPKGTVMAIGLSQRWKCVVCRKGIRGNFHVDHITALANGGEHKPQNIQLLCPTCNVRKSAKDPIEFMQSRGYLL